MALVRDSAQNIRRGVDNMHPPSHRLGYTEVGIKRIINLIKTRRHSRQLCGVRLDRAWAFVEPEVGVFADTHQLCVDRIDGVVIYITDVKRFDHSDLILNRWPGRRLSRVRAQIGGREADIITRRGVIGNQFSHYALKGRGLGKRQRRRLRCR